MAQGEAAAPALPETAMATTGNECPTLTNDEVTWTNLVPAAPEEQQFFDRSYVPMLSQAYIHEKQGGATEVQIVDRETWADNVDAKGGLNEDKTSVMSYGNQDRSQFRRYLEYLDENPGVSLEYNFFANPSHAAFGPYRPFADVLADAATRYDIGVHIFSEGWWEELQ